MNEIDPQMEQLKSAYETVRYPGDLARDLDLASQARRSGGLPQSGLRPSGWWMAIAASVALVVGLLAWSMLGTGSNKPVVKSNEPVNNPSIIAQNSADQDVETAVDEEIVASMQDMSAPSWPVDESSAAISAPSSAGVEGVSWGAVSAPSFPSSNDSSSESGATQGNLSL